MTPEEAKLRCFDLPDCRGFCFKGLNMKQQHLIHFKNKWDIKTGENTSWTSFEVAGAA
jgi:hypothetical protein